MSVNDENFLDLLERYIDEEAISEKINLDSKNDENVIDKNIRLEFDKNDTISIRKFVNDYLKIQSSCEGLLHKGLKSFESKYVMTISNEFAHKNPEFVQNGYLLLVLDTHHNLATYINPYYLKKVIESGDVEKVYRIFSKKVINDFNELQEYFETYNRLSANFENTRKFFAFLKEVKKDRKVKRLIEEETKNNEEIKRK